MAENLEGHLKRFGISKEQVQNFPDSNVSTIIDRITDLEGVKPKNSDNMFGIELKVSFEKRPFDTAACFAGFENKSEHK